jgi:hypothetical protein
LLQLTHHEGGRGSASDFIVKQPYTVIASKAEQSMAQHADRWIASLRSQ